MSKNWEIFLSLGAIITLIGTSLHNGKKHKIWKSALTVKQAKPGYEHCSYYRSLHFWVLISVNNIDVTGERGAFIENYYFPNLEKIGKKGLFLFFSFSTFWWSNRKHVRLGNFDPGEALTSKGRSLSQCLTHQYLEETKHCFSSPFSLVTIF